MSYLSVRKFGGDGMSHRGGRSTDSRQTEAEVQHRLVRYRLKCCVTCRLSTTFSAGVGKDKEVGSMHAFRGSLASQSSMCLRYSKMGFLPDTSREQLGAIVGRVSCTRIGHPILVVNIGMILRSPNRLGSAC